MNSPEFMNHGKKQVKRNTPVIIQLEIKNLNEWLANEIPDKTTPHVAMLDLSMLETAKYIVDVIPTAVFAHVASGNISILLNDWKTDKTIQYLNGDEQQIISEVASLATSMFNLDWKKQCRANLNRDNKVVAVFNINVFNLNLDEVSDYFIWKQKLVIENNFKIIGNFYFTPPEIYSKSSAEIITMLKTKNINYQDDTSLHTIETCITKESVEKAPDFILDRQYIEKHLEKDVPLIEIFVFGSNLAGRHGKGAALFARQKHGAVYGNGLGIQGTSYAIPTKGKFLKTLPLETIRSYVNEFIAFANSNPNYRFNVTRIGCGLAGYKDSQIAPFFADAPKNCILPEEWVTLLNY